MRKTVTLLFAFIMALSASTAKATVQTIMNTSFMTGVPGGGWTTSGGEYYTASTVYTPYGFCFNAHNAGTGGSATNIFTVRPGFTYTATLVIVNSGFNSTQAITVKSSTTTLVSATNVGGNTVVLTFTPGTGVTSLTLKLADAGITNASDGVLQTAKITYDDAQVLPVSLTDFVVSTMGCTANLTWQTATEVNSGFYAVEASVDGSNFNQIAKVPSKNNATGASYVYLCAVGSGTTFFRLKAVDFDNKFSYSGTVAVAGTGACNVALSVKISPNPTSNVINIQGLVSGSHISLININGQKLVEVLASGTSQTMSLSSYAKGIYIIRIQQADGAISNVKVVKQ